MQLACMCPSASRLRRRLVFCHFVALPAAVRLLRRHGPCTPRLIEAVVLLGKVQANCSSGEAPETCRSGARVTEGPSPTLSAVFFHHSLIHILLQASAHYPATCRYAGHLHFPLHRRRGSPGPTRHQPSAPRAVSGAALLCSRTAAPLQEGRLDAQRLPARPHARSALLHCSAGVARQVGTVSDAAGMVASGPALPPTGPPTAPRPTPSPAPPLTTQAAPCRLWCHEAPCDAGTRPALPPH